MTLKELELAIVRVAEKWPDRVGLAWVREQNGDMCILGQIGHDLLCDPWFCAWEVFDTGPAFQLAVRAVAENNVGTPWGQIPIRLGLVPGEQPVSQQEPITEPTQQLEEVLA